MNYQRVAPLALVLASLTGCADEAPAPLPSTPVLDPSEIIEGGEIVGTIATPAGLLIARFDAEGLWLTHRRGTAEASWTRRVLHRQPGDEAQLRALQLAVTTSGQIVLALQSERGVSFQRIDPEGGTLERHDDLADVQSPYRLLGTTTHGEDVHLLVSWMDELAIEQVGRLAVPPADVGDVSVLQITHHTPGEEPDLLFGRASYSALSNGRIVIRSVLGNEAAQHISVFDHTTEHSFTISPVQGPGSSAELLADDDTHVLVQATASGGDQKLLRYADGDSVTPVLQKSLPAGTQAVTQAGERWIAVAMGEGATPGQLDWLVYELDGSYEVADADLGPAEQMDVTSALGVGDHGFAISGSTGVYVFDKL